MYRSLCFIYDEINNTESLSKDRHYGEREYKLGVSIGSLPLENREPFGQGGGKIIGVRVWRTP